MEKCEKEKDNFKIPKRIYTLFDAYFATVAWKKNGYGWCKSCEEFLDGTICPKCHKEYAINGFVPIMDEDYELCTYCIVYFQVNTVYVLKKSIYIYDDNTSSEDVKYEGIYLYQDGAIIDCISKQMLINQEGNLVSSDYNVIMFLFTVIDYLDEKSIKEFGGILEKDVTYLNQMKNLSIISLLYSPFYYKDFDKFYKQGLKKLAYIPRYKIENGNLVIGNCEIEKKYKSFIIKHDLGVEEIETLQIYHIKDMAFISVLKHAKKEIEHYIYERTYKDTPYEKGVPLEVATTVREEVIEPLFASLDFQAIYRYFKRNNISANKIISYFTYRYLLFRYYDFVKKLYYDSKEFPYFYLKCSNEQKGIKKNLYISYKKYPKNFIHVENTLLNVPKFEYEELFCKENDLLEHLYDLEQDGLSFSSLLEKNLFIQTGYIVVENIEALESYLEMTIVRMDEYSLYNLYDYIYDQKLKDFLEENHYYFHNCTLEVIKEFYAKTHLKLKYCVYDKYRRFTFDCYGILGTGGFGEDIYTYGKYAEDMLSDQYWENYDKMKEDCDLRIVMEVQHIDYDEEGIYYQNYYDKWDPLYEDAMEEEEKADFTNKEGKKIYLFKKLDK